MAKRSALRAVNRDGLAGQSHGNAGDGFASTMDYASTEFADNLKDPAKRDRAHPRRSPRRFCVLSCGYAIACAVQRNRSAGVCIELLSVSLRRADRYMWADDRDDL